MKRKNELVNDAVYHVFNRSIAGFKIFNNENEYARMKKTVSYYRYTEQAQKLSRYLRKVDENENDGKQSKIVQIIAYCFMPTHYHFVLKQNEDKGIEKFVGKMQNSYSKYFNTKHERKGPLWEGRFKNIPVETDEQLLHLTRYLHLNPTSSSLTKHLEEWKHSSYHEYITPDQENKMCDFSGLISIKPDQYKDFVLDNLDYQRELNRIKHLVIE